MLSLPLFPQVPFHIVDISHQTPFFLILLSPPSEWHGGDGEWGLLSACNTLYLLLHLLTFLPLLQHGVPHEGYSRPWTSPSHRVGPLHGVQTTRNALLQQNSAMGCSSCQHLLLHCVPTAWTFLSVSPVLGPSTGLRADLCSPTDPQEHSCCKGDQRGAFPSDNWLYLLIVPSSCVNGLPYKS